MAHLEGQPIAHTFEAPGFDPHPCGHSLPAGKTLLTLPAKAGWLHGATVSIALRKAGALELHHSSVRLGARDSAESGFL